MKIWFHLPWKTQLAYKIYLFVKWELQLVLLGSGRENVAYFGFFSVTWDGCLAINQHYFRSAPAHSDLVLQIRKSWPSKQTIFLSNLAHMLIETAGGCRI